MESNYPIKIAVLTAFYSRYNVSRVVAKAFSRLQFYDIDRFHIKGYGVTHEPQNFQWLTDYGYKTITYPTNKPISEKFNFAVRYIRDSFDFDFLMIIDSDDIVTNSLLDVYQPYFDEGHDIFGAKECYFYDPARQETIYFPGYSHMETHSHVEMAVGAGRVFSRRAVDAMNGNMWMNGINEGLNYNSQIRLYERGFEETVIPLQDRAAVLDIKTAMNIHKFSHFDNFSRVNTDTLLSRFPEKKWISGLSQYYETVGK